MWNRKVLLYFSERFIDGEAFTQLTREELGMIYHSNEKFLLASKLYRIAQRRQYSTRDTSSLLAELSEAEGDLLTSPAPSVSSSNSAWSLKRHLERDDPPNKKKCTEHVASKFTLPVFSPDIKKCIRGDAFYTSTQRNRLIKEACVALRGYCWEREKSILNHDKKNLAKMLCELAPKSLSDQGTSHSSPEVSLLHMGWIVYFTLIMQASLYGQIIRWFQNHSYSSGDTKLPSKKKKSLPPCSDDDDNEAIQVHLKELEKEVKRKSPDEDKLARLLCLTFTGRRNTMLAQTANARVTSAIQKYPCLKQPIFVSRVR